MRRLIHHDLYASLAALVFFVVMEIITFGLPTPAARFPRLVLGIAILLALVTCYEAIVRSRSLRGDEAAEAAYLKWRLIKAPLVATLYVTAYAVAMEYLGFFVATSGFLVGFLYYCKVRDWRQIAGAVIGMNLFIYALFVLQLGIQFPTGLLF